MACFGITRAMFNTPAAAFEVLNLMTKEQALAGMHNPNCGEPCKSRVLGYRHKIGWDMNKNLFF
jgi:hypothetical protein